MSSSPYHNKVMAAPMVRVSTLAFRLLCAHHTADVVFTEELVAAKLAKCGRRFLPPTMTATTATSVSSSADGEQTLPLLPAAFRDVLTQTFSTSSEGEQKNKKQDDGDDDSSSPHQQKTRMISSVLKRWKSVLPFLAQTLLAGRVEVIYHGHPGEQKKGGGGEGEGDESSARPGEIVFTTLADMTTSPSGGNSTNNNSNTNNEELPRHNIPGLTFSRKEGSAVLIGQIGASDPAVAVAAFHLLAPFVSGMDVNMGCPKAFSVKNGMGAALMTNKDKGAAILGAMAAAFPALPISYKTRLFENVADNIEHLRACLTATGGRLHALTLHSRNRPQRSETAPLYSDATDLASRIRTSLDSPDKKLTLIFNGSVAMRPTLSSSASGSASAASDKKEEEEETQQHQQQQQQQTSSSLREIAVLASHSIAGKHAILQSVHALGFDGALVARASMWKPSVFLSSYAETSMPVVSSSAAFSKSSSSSSSSKNPDAEEQTTSNNSDNDNNLYTLVLREFQCLTVAYAACGDNTRLLKYHLTRAIPEYQQLAATALHQQQLHQLRSSPTSVFDPSTRKLKTLFESLQNGRTLEQFAKALMFSDEEVSALLWLDELVAWRRTTTAVAEVMTPPKAAESSGQGGGGGGAPCRRDRE